MRTDAGKVVAFTMSSAMLVEMIRSMSECMNRNHSPILSDIGAL